MLGAVAAVLISVGVGAQGRNFGGTWVMDAEKTIAAGGGQAGGRGGGGGGVARSGGDGSAATVAVAGGGGGRGGGGVVGGTARSGGSGMVAVNPGLAITVDATSFTIANGPTTTTYKLDGSITTIENPARKTTAKASWQGDKIAIETTAEGPDGPIVTHATWYLEGDSLVRENRSNGPDGQEVLRKTYYKRS
jgi:hypothetical protein